MDFYDLKREYMGDGDKSYLVLSVPIDEEIKRYQVGMLEKNRNEMLLPMYVQRMNNDWKLSYDITSRIPLNKVLERKSLRHQEFEYLIRQFTVLMHVLKDYLLDLSSIVLDKAYIYCDPSRLSLYFIYLPVKTIDHSDKLKSFLMKLIIEDIRLMEDQSGHLLKKLLDGLKSETFTIEQISRSIDASAIQGQSNLQDTTVEQRQSPAQIPETALSSVEMNIRGTEPGLVPNKSKQQRGSPLAGTNEPKQQRGLPPAGTNEPRQKRGSSLAGTNEPKQQRGSFPAGTNGPKQQRGSPPIGTNEQYNRQTPSDDPKTGRNVFRQQWNLLQKYPKSSWLIAGAVNTGILCILGYVIAASMKNPGNTVNNILGLLLIGGACNYFLITRLFSKGKMLTADDDKREPARNSMPKKRFVNEEMDEDIILPGTRMNQNRMPVNTNLFSFPQNSMESEESMRKEGSGVFIMKPDWNRHRNDHANTYRESENGWNHAGEGKTPESVLIRIEEDMPVLNKGIPMENDYTDFNRSQAIEARTQDFGQEQASTAITPESGSSPDKASASPERIRNQMIPDETVVLAGLSERVPCLVSQIRPAERILLNKSPILIGRLADSVDFVIENRAVGKIHAEVKKIGEQYFIIDLNSVNGTYVNDERLICNMETQMKDGDKITLANETYMFIA